jgi:hypothetical protein
MQQQAQQLAALPIQVPSAATQVSQGVTTAIYLRYGVVCAMRGSNRQPKGGWIKSRYKKKKNLASHVTQICNANQANSFRAAWAC